MAELGVEGRLIKIQLDDMTEWVPGDRIALVRDYDVPEVIGGLAGRAGRRSTRCPTRGCWSSRSWARCWATRVR